MQTEVLICNQQEISHFRLFSPHGGLPRGEIAVLFNTIIVGSSIYLRFPFPRNSYLPDSAAKFPSRCLMLINEDPMDPPEKEAASTR